MEHMPRSITGRLGLILCVGALLLSGAPWAAAQDSIYEAISGNPNLSSLQRGIDTLGFSEALADPSLPYTLLAPGNEAFTEAAAALNVTVSDLLDQPSAALEALVLYHLLPSLYNANDLPEGNMEVTTAAGPSYGPLTLRRSGTSVSVAGRGSEARVVITNLPAGEGLVHVVDSVLLPFYTDVLQALERNPDLSQVTSALVTTGLAGALDNPNTTLTVFAPTNDALNRTLEYFIRFGIEFGVPELVDLLTYHVVPSRLLSTDVSTQPISLPTLQGENITVVATSSGISITAKNINATVQVADIPVGFGPRSVVHIVDWALVPFYPTVAAAVGGPEYSIFRAVVQAEGSYVDIINGFVPASGTILAPNNDAFTALLTSAGITQEQLLSEALRDTVKAILDLHIVPGSPLRIEALSDGDVLNTNGLDTLRVRKVNGTVTVQAPGSTATLLSRESTPTIAVITIDTVLLPGSTPAPSPQPPSYGGYGGYGYGYAPPPPPYGGYYGGYGGNRRF